MSSSLRLTLLVLLVVATSARIEVARADATLIATVTAKGRLSLTTSSGAPVIRLGQGRYRIVVRDRARSHNFHLVGPGVERKTSIASTALVRWVVTLRQGDYTFRCDRHPRQSRKSFAVA
jgi:hypothetical protein